MRNIYFHIHPHNAQQLHVNSAGFEALSSSFELHPGGQNYILALQHHAGQTAVLQALTVGHIIYHIISNDYSTKIFVDNF